MTARLSTHKRCCTQKTEGQFVIFIEVWRAEDRGESEKKVVTVGRRGGRANTHSAALAREIIMRDQL